jgi:hypothetical protein
MGHCGCRAGGLEDVAHSPPSHTLVSAALEAGTLSSAGPSSSVEPYHDNAPDLGLDTMMNDIEELGLSQFDDEVLFVPTQPTPARGCRTRDRWTPGTGAIPHRQ